jgi:hypothetical protein
MKQNGKLRAADFVKFHFGAMALTNYLGPKTLHQHASSQQLYSRELNMRHARVSLSTLTLRSRRMSVSVVSVRPRELLRRYERSLMLMV